MSAGARGVQKKASGLLKLELKGAVSHYAQVLATKPGLLPKQLELLGYLSSPGIFFNTSMSEYALR